MAGGQPHSRHLRQRPRRLRGRAGVRPERAVSGGPSPGPRPHRGGRDILARQQEPRRARECAGLSGADPKGAPVSNRRDIQLQVMWNRLLAVVEEQAQTLVRTAFSTSTREAGDVSAGIFDLKGQMLAQAVTGTPGHINSMALSVGHFLERFPVATMGEGDCYLTNDPWKGTGHLNDFTVVSPAH